MPLASVIPSPVLNLIPLLAMAFIGGSISLSYEIFFFRTLSYTTGGSAKAFAITLGAFLIGLASGSRQASISCRELSADGARRCALRSLVMANLLGFLFLPALNHLAWLERGMLGLAILMVYLLARCWGTLLPCLAHLGVASNDSAGMGTSLLYLANILGSAAGSILTGFVLMDHLGLADIATALVLAGLVYAMLLAVTLVKPRRLKLALAGWTVTMGTLALLMLHSPTSNVLENLQSKGAQGVNIPFAQVVENRSGIIAVDQTGTVFGNGMYDGKFNTDLIHDTNGILRPYALSLFHPAPRNVLMIGLSSGSWAQVIANNPAVATLTIIEINPGCVKIIAQRPEVASVLTNPKVSIITDDGRRWLRLNPDRHFDAIISNTTWYFRSNVTNLLSMEFLDLIKSHLKPKGIFFYNTTGSSRVQRTACQTFPFGARFSNHMVVAMSPIDWDVQRWCRTLEAYRIDGRPIVDPHRAEDAAVLQDLLKLNSIETNKLNFIETIQPFVVTSDQDRLIEPCSDILARTSGKSPVTDDNMGSEWRHDWGFE